MLHATLGVHQSMSVALRSQSSDLRSFLRNQGRREDAQIVKMTATRSLVKMTATRSLRLRKQQRGTAGNERCERQFRLLQHLRPRGAARLLRCVPARLPHAACLGSNAPPEDEDEGIDVVVPPV